ncbi:hypothetical protein Sjap_001653 [Stephania japonica]|uniref:Origin of replication complex subunit 3 n=1 Tax=Stephania japonica TaxID=461633 RepID=A0AAP0KLW6_9MAGN
MAPSKTPDSPPPSSSTDDSENSLQPFFVLHKALPQKGGGRVNRSGKSKRKINLSASPESAFKSGGGEQFEEDADYHFEQLRIEAFDVVWPKIETTIKEVLRNINGSVFNKIHDWICDSFHAIRSARKPSVWQISCPYPLATDISSRQIHTGLVFTKNVEFVDDLVTFKDLSMHLRSKGCHVVSLSSLDFSGKHGLGGCLRSLLRQLLLVSPDSADVSILASWYREPENCDSPLVMIIDEMERCGGLILSDFILMLSEWVVKLPVILILGIATTDDSLRNVLQLNVLQHLRPCTFSLGSPAGKLDAIIEAVFLKNWSGFYIGHEVVAFFRNYFSMQDGTVTSFIRALKIACTKHFLMEPLSFLCEGFVHEDFQGFWTEKCSSLRKPILKYASDLPSCETRHKSSGVTCESLAFGLSEMKKQHKDWVSVLLCLYEVAKLTKVPLLGIFCEALDPKLYNLRASPNYFAEKIRNLEASAVKKSEIVQLVRRVRNSAGAPLRQLLLAWGKHTEDIAEIHVKLKELENILEDEENTVSQECDEATFKRLKSRSHLNARRVNDKAAELMECMIKNYLRPMECTPLHEIVCFKQVKMLKLALIGDPRRTIQIDLLKSHNYLHYNCGPEGGNAPLRSMHDTAILYTLAQEHGDLINLHDWFQSFKSIILVPSPSKKRKSGHRTPDHRATQDAKQETTSAVRYCRAKNEYNICRLILTPYKRGGRCRSRKAKQP